MAKLEIRPNGDKGSLLSRMDFHVDGVPLKETLRVASGSNVCALGWSIDSDEHHIAVLRGEKASDVPTGRVQLYVCRECGDIGCGATTAKVTISDRIVTWSEFGHESTIDYDGNGPELSYFAKWAPDMIEFDFDEYSDAFARYLAERRRSR